MTMIKDQLNVLVQIASSDNMIAEKEMRLIKIIGMANGVSSEDIEKIVKDPKPIENLENLSDDQKFEYLYNVVQLMKADGQVFKSEINFCEEIAEKLGYNKGVIGELSSRIFADPSITTDKNLIKKKIQKYLK